MVTPFAISFSPQRLTHRSSRICLADGIEMAIDVGGGAHVAVSEPFLDLLHWHALGKKYRGTGVAQIVETYFLQIMLLQKLSEVLRDKIGIVELAEGIYADVVGVFIGVRRAHHLFHLLLLLSVLQQFPSYEGLESQRAV